MGRKMWLLALLTLFAAALVGLPAPAKAQADAEYWGLAQFNFQNPGARARGLGGAFVALADDATAAYSNPAGLAFLTRWEVGLEYSFVDLKSEVAQLSGPPPHYRVESSIETDGLSYGSVVFPLSKGRLTGAVYYADLSPLRDFGSQVFIPGYEDEQVAYFDTAASLDATNEVFGAAIGWRINDRFSIGGSIANSDLSLTGISPRYLSSGALANTEYSEIDDSAIFVTVGGLWSVSDRFSIGASWQKETDYQVNSFKDVAGGTENDFSIESTFQIPTRWALGAAFRPTDSWVIALEWDRVEYSDIYAGMNEVSFFSHDDAEFRFTVDDVDELHLGTEYSWFSEGGTGFSLRAGVWQDVEHLPYYEPEGGADPSARRSPKHDDSIYHYTGGVGLSFAHFMIDVAADVSDVGDNYLGSVVFRF